MHQKVILYVILLIREHMTFVFLANEPANIPVLNQLKSISNYCDLDNIAYPERFFTSDQIIPMKQEIKQVTVLANGKGPD